MKTIFYTYAQNTFMPSTRFGYMSIKHDFLNMMP